MRFDPSPDQYQEHQVSAHRYVDMLSSDSTCTKFEEVLGLKVQLRERLNCSTDGRSSTAVLCSLAIVLDHA